MYPATRPTITLWRFSHILKIEAAAVTHNCDGLFSTPNQTTNCYCWMPRNRLGVPGFTVLV